MPPVEIEWTDERTTIICELFAEQVNIGNRPNTHLNSVGYGEVAKRFTERTGLAIERGQLKNKWAKLMAQYTVWNKLLLRQTGKGWDAQKGTLKMDDEWWGKMKKEIPGSWPFRKRGLQNEDLCAQMFREINVDGEDHWCPTGTQPSEGEFTNISDGEEEEAEQRDEEEVQEISPSTANGKRAARGVPSKGKKPKIGSAAVIQGAIRSIADSASSVAGKKNAVPTVKEVMDHVIECGASIGSNEHYIATSLFVKSDQREMFKTMPQPEMKFQWLQRKYQEKYGI
ncbi:hypothetical protein ACP70R_047862 [Stipagrostis hirtigluma subsp. patula]